MSVFFAGPRGAIAQKTLPLPIEDTLDLKMFAHGLREFSPDGKWLAYAAATNHRKSERETHEGVFYRTGVSSNAHGSDIRIVNVHSRKERNLTEGKGNNSLPTWSPDGRMLAFLSNRDGSGQAKLWVWDVEKDVLRKVSDVLVRSAAEIEWTEDSRNIVLTILPTGLSMAEYLALIYPQPEAAKGTEGSAKSTAILYRSDPAGQNAVKSDPLTLGTTIRDLAVVNVKSGEVRTLVHNEKIGTFHVFEDGSRVAYSSPERFEELGSQQVLHTLAVADISTGKRMVVATGLRLDLQGRFSVSPDGRTIGFRTTGADGVFDIHAVDLESKEVRNLSHFEKPKTDRFFLHLHRWYFSFTLFWDSEGKNLYSLTDGKIFESSLAKGTTREVAHVPGRLIRHLMGRDASRLAIDPKDSSTIVIARDEEQKQDGFYRVDLKSGASSKLLERGECYTCSAGPRGRLAALSNDGQQIAYTSQSAEHPDDIWVSDVTFQNPSRLTHINPQLEAYAMGRARLIDWLDCDGHRLRGGLVLPVNYREGQRYPLIVFAYGGEMMSDYLPLFGGFEKGLPYLNVQLLATRGYAVLMPDAPQKMGTPMLDLAKTILPGVNRVIELGIADPNRLGVVGHSYGGYSVLSLLVQTNRFQAAVAIDGMANMFTLYGEMDKEGVAYGTSSETGQELVGGDPWHYRDRYLENSPFFYLDRVETPVLLAHGSEDSTLSPILSDEVFVALRRLGKTVEYARYEGEEHEFVDPKNQLDACQRILAWFDRYVRKTP